MAPSFVASAIGVVVQVLPFLGIHVAQGDLETTINTLTAIFVGLFVLYRQVKTGRATPLGTRPS